MDRNGAASTPGWLKWGNHPYFMVAWAILGIACGSSVPRFLMIRDDNQINEKIYTWSPLAGFATLILYAFGYLLRRLEILRRKPAWFANVIGNICASTIAIWVGVSHKSTSDARVAYTFLAVVVFALMEITKPACDYGVLQYFLRLPLQTAIICKSVKWCAILATLLVFCTSWQAYFLYILPHPDLGSETPQNKRGLFWLQWGNHKLTTIFWAIFGSVCGMVAPYFWFENEHDLELWMSWGCILTCYLCFFGYFLRVEGFMRKEIGWYATAIGNCCASSLVIWISVSHERGHDAATGFIFLALAVFGLFEVVKPKCDFGLLQFFFRLPFQTDIAHFGLPVVRWYFVDALLLIFCTMWQSYFLLVVPDPTSKMPQLGQLGVWGSDSQFEQSEHLGRPGVGE